VNELLTKVLPTVVNFDPKQIFLEGVRDPLLARFSPLISHRFQVSGGSLLLSGFMIPTFAASLAVPGAVLGCGGLVPYALVSLLRAVPH
jgi:uncharacterized membrane protein YphA (DoxX/SURF4 family)